MQIFAGREERIELDSGSPEVKVPLLFWLCAKLRTMVGIMGSAGAPRWQRSPEELFHGPVEHSVARLGTSQNFWDVLGHHGIWLERREHRVVITKCFTFRSVSSRRAAWFNT